MIMIEMQHTPGPWTYEYSPYKAQDGREIPAFEIHGAEKVCDTNEDRPAAEQEADARLISAAPEMFTALKLATFTAECLWHLQGNDEARKVAEIGRAALALAVQ